IGFGAFQCFDPQHGRVEAGMVLNAESRARGFGKEGLHALITHAFAVFPVNEVWIQHAADHALARGVPVSLGLSLNTDGAAYGVPPGKCVWSAFRESWWGHEKLTDGESLARG